MPQEHRIHRRVREHARGKRNARTEHDPRHAAREIHDFVTSTEYAAAFFSCSPTQKSYPSQSSATASGPITCYAAFRGHEPKAFARERSTTGELLRDYLAMSVPAFIREQTTIKDDQTPYAVLAANGAFEF